MFRDSDLKIESMPTNCRIFHRRHKADMPRSPIYAYYVQCRQHGSWRILVSTYDLEFAKSYCIARGIVAELVEK